MKTVALKRDQIFCGPLLLVNRNSPLKNDAEDELVSADLRFPDILMKREAANVLQFILEKISAGTSIVPVSGYRCAEEQTEIYENSLKENGEAFTQKFVALPRHSEHQTGLAVDLALNRKEIDFICPAFPYDGVCGEFREKAPDYGFIERYPAGKETITGIDHEPWHFRYVGFPHSKIMQKSGFSLEEYIAFIKTCRRERKYVYRQKNKPDIAIYYVPANSDITPICLPDHAVYQISGNNMDGFIVTVWGKINGQS